MVRSKLWSAESTRGGTLATEDMRIDDDLSEDDLRPAAGCTVIHLPVSREFKDCRQSLKSDGVVRPLKA
jgi:hypothetical protein